jgi:hypothetical protein
MSRPDSTWGVRDLTVRYGSRVALDGVTLEAPPGTSRLTPSSAVRAP